MTHRNHGFALPVIMLVSLALMSIALTMLQNSASLRASIDDQYYNRLAEEAAQSGVTFAVDCLSNSGFTQTWTSPLTQSQNCDSSAASPAISSVSPQTDTVSTFSVGDIEGRSDGAVLVTSVGTTKRIINGTSTAAKTYTKTVKRVASSAYIKFKGVTFGYYYYDIGAGIPNPAGAYYFVKGSDGKLRAAGANAYGQLGFGNQTDSLSPQEVTMPDGKVAAGAFTNFLSQGWSAFILTTDGNVYGTGLGDRGQLGNGSNEKFIKRPERFQLPDGEKATYVGLLGYANYVFTESHNIYAAGECYAGELGYDCGSDWMKSVPVRVNLPAPDESDPNTIPEEDFVADSRAAYIRMAGGAVYGWGGNAEGNLGDGTRYDSVTPKKMCVQSASFCFGDSGKPKAAKIAFDGITFFILDDSGAVWAAGSNQWGQMGLGTFTDRYLSFQKIWNPSTRGSRVVQMSTDQWFVNLRTSANEVWSAGLNHAGQLGNNQTNYRERSFVKYQLPAGVKPVDVYNSSIGDDSSGLADTFVVGNNGKVYGAGGNGAGQLGNNTTTGSSKPVEMQVFGKGVRATSVQYAFGTTVILTNKGKYYTVGNNSTGQLGNGNTSNTKVPAEAKFLQPASGSFVF